MKLWAILGEGAKRHELDLEVRVEGDQLVLESEQMSVSAHVAPLPDGESYSILVGGRSYEVAIQEEGRDLVVFLDGRRFRAAVRSPLEKILREVVRPTPVRSGYQLEAPMPGRVVLVRAKPGDRVHPGQPLVVMEAMKMQNELQAEAAGVVQAVHVAPGDTVEAGRRLLTVAAAEGNGA